MVESLRPRAPLIQTNFWILAYATEVAPWIPVECKQTIMRAEILFKVVHNCNDYFDRINQLSYISLISWPIPKVAMQNEEKSGLVYNPLTINVITYFFVAWKDDNLFLKILLPVLMILGLVAVVSVVFVYCRKSRRLVFIRQVCGCVEPFESSYVPQYVVLIWRRHW